MAIYICGSDREEMRALTHAMMPVIASWGDARPRGSRVWTNRSVAPWGMRSRSRRRLSTCATRTRPTYTARAWRGDARARRGRARSRRGCRTIRAARGSGRGVETLSAMIAAQGVLGVADWNGEAAVGRCRRALSILALRSRPRCSLLLHLVDLAPETRLQTAPACRPNGSLTWFPLRINGAARPFGTDGATIRKIVAWGAI